MLNIIKADTKRILRSKSVWVMPILILIMTAMLSALFAGLKYVMSLDLSAVLGDSMDSLAAIGTIASTGYDMAIMNLQSDTLIYVMLVILLSVSAFDFSSGTIKNMLSIGKSKQQIYISKLITSCIWTVLGVLFYSFSSVLMGSIFFGFDVTGSQIVDVLLITLQQIPVYLAVIMTGHMFVFMTQKVAGSIMLYIGTLCCLKQLFRLLI
jgi:ABC-2 type transport system permease protein